MSAVPARRFTSQPAIAARTRLSTLAVAPHRRLGYWVGVICQSFVKLECEGLMDDTMDGTVDSVALGSLQLTHLRANGQKVRRTAAQIRASDDDCLLLQVQRAGRCIVRQDGRVGIAAPGELMLYDTARPYELVFDDFMHEAFILRLPRTQLALHLGRPQELTAAALAAGHPAATVLRDMLHTLHRQADGLPAASADSMAEAVLSTVVAGLRCLPGANLHPRSRLAAYHLARVRHYVGQHLRDPGLSVASVAQALQMSPDSLARLFRHEPQPLSRWLWQQRLEACRRELCDPRNAARSISSIAYGWGFTNAAHFSRSFRQQFGDSARELRHAALRGASPLSTPR